MKRQLAAVFAGILYAAVLVGLLVLQSLTMENQITRLAANGAALCLVLPFLGFMWGYVKIQRGDKKGSAASGLDEKVKQAQDRKPSSHISMQESREVFYKETDLLGLSSREKEVAWLIYRGFTNRQIAEELFISETTVKKHAGHIYEKMNLSGRRELQAFFINKEKSLDSDVTS